MRDTSLETYKWLKDEKILGTREYAVFTVILNNPNKTDKELSEILLQDDPNYVRPRRRDLERYGIVESNGKRNDTIRPNRMAYVWRIKQFSKETVLKNKLKIKQVEINKKDLKITEMHKGLINIENNIKQLIQKTQNQNQTKLNRFLK